MKDFDRERRELHLERVKNLKALLLSEKECREERVLEIINNFSKGRVKVKMNGKSEILVTNSKEPKKFCLDEKSENDPHNLHKLCEYIINETRKVKPKF